MLLCEHAAGGIEWILVIALNADALAWGWCMDVFAITDVDADVVWALAAPEDEVAWLEAVEGYLADDSDLIIGGAWQADAVLCEDILDKAAAVETGWGGAAPYIWHADVVHGAADDVAGGGVVDGIEDLILFFFVNGDVGLWDIHFRQGHFWGLYARSGWCFWFYWCHWGLRLNWFRWGLGAIVHAVEMLGRSDHGIDGSLEIWRTWLGLYGAADEGGISSLCWRSAEEAAESGHSTEGDCSSPFFQIQEGSRPSFDGACR